MLEKYSQEDLEQKWEEIKKFFSDKFADGDRVDVDSILYLIGVQELGTGRTKFEKEEKIELMHMATCKLLEPFGYFEFQNTDHEGWSHYRQIKNVDSTSETEQFKLLQKAVVFYFEENVW